MFEISRHDPHSSKEKEALENILISENLLEALRFELPNILKVTTRKEINFLLEATHHPIRRERALNRLTWLCLPQIYKVLSSNKTEIEIEDALAQMLLITQEVIVEKPDDPKYPRLRERVLAKGRDYFNQERRKGPEQILNAGLLTIENPNKIPAPEDVEDNIWLRNALDTLTPKESYAAVQINNNPNSSLQEIGKGIGVTQERIRQLNASALRKLREQLPPEERILISERPPHENIGGTKPTPEVKETIKPEDKLPPTDLKRETVKEPDLWKEQRFVEYLSAMRGGQNYLHSVAEHPEIIIFEKELLQIAKEMSRIQIPAWFFVNKQDGNLHQTWTRMPETSDMKRLGLMQTDLINISQSFLHLTDSQLYFHPQHLLPLITGQQNFTSLVNGKEMLLALRTRDTILEPNANDDISLELRKIFGRFVPLIRNRVLGPLVITNLENQYAFIQEYLSRRYNIAIYQGEISPKQERLELKMLKYLQ